MPRGPRSRPARCQPRCGWRRRLMSGVIETPNGSASSGSRCDTSHTSAGAVARTCPSGGVRSLALVTWSTRTRDGCPPTPSPSDGPVAPGRQWSACRTGSTPLRWSRRAETSLGMRRRLERSTLRSLDAVHLFFPSEAAEVAEIAEAELPAGFFSNPSPSIADSDRWVGDGDYFVWIGRFVIGHKGLDLLLRGWAELPAPGLVSSSRDRTTSAGRPRWTRWCASSI